MSPAGAPLRLPAGRDVRLLPRDALVKTSALDQADWNYRPVLGWVSRLRWRAVAAVLARRTYHRVLEVGYGSGVFLPELARHAEQVFAVDVHGCAPAVRSVLARQGITAHLAVGSAGALPFAGGTFDLVVAVSTLEFVPDVGAAVRELLRVTAPSGTALVVTPGRSRLLDAGLRLLTGHRAEDTFEGRRGSIVPAFEESSDVTVHRVPRRLHTLAPLYSVVEAVPHARAGDTVG